MPKYLLCLDGGGVAGVCQAVFLHRLEQAAGFPIRELFDALVGTSIGAILVTGLVYNEKITADEVANKLFTRANANRMMPASRFDKIANVLQHEPKYDGIEKAKLIREYVPDTPLLYPPRGNLVAVTAFNCGQGRPIFIKSWDTTDKRQYIFASVAADTSSAAPAFYPSVNLKANLAPDHPSAQHDVDFGCDGAVFCNNPTDCAYADMIKIWGKNENIRILSVGTGLRPFRPVGNLYELKIQCLI
jgi:patatin-like phospholipase/acyl hydrolase